MPKLKFSLITVALNAGDTIDQCLCSVSTQAYGALQHIVVDGGSNDQTLEVIGRYIDRVDVVITGPDRGIYDGMNKGIAVARGDIIGFLNADDFFADDYVLHDIAEAFSDPAVQIVYGDLDFIDSEGRIVRKWRSGRYRHGLCNWGWMPPHPTFYCRRELFRELGAFKLDYGSAADYELMLRFIHGGNAGVYYLQRVLVKMFRGGVSNSSFWNRIKALRFDLRAMHENGIRYPWLTILFKPLRKIWQFL